MVFETISYASSDTPAYLGAGDGDRTRTVFLPSGLKPDACCQFRHSSMAGWEGDWATAPCYRYPKTVVVAWTGGCGGGIRTRVVRRMRPLSNRYSTPQYVKSFSCLLIIARGDVVVNRFSKVFQKPIGKNKTERSQSSSCKLCFRFFSGVACPLFVQRVDCVSDSIVGNNRRRNRCLALVSYLYWKVRTAQVLSC